MAKTYKAPGLIRDRMLLGESDEKQKKALEQALKMRAVSAVSSTQGTVLSIETAEEGIFNIIVRRLILLMWPSLGPVMAVVRESIQPTRIKG